MLTTRLRQGDGAVRGWLVGLAFAYGILHALGPGHGKVLVASFMVANRTKLRRAVVQGALAAFLHGTSAIIIVTLIRTFALGRSTQVFGVWSANLEVFSYALISLLGLFLVVTQCYEIVRKEKHGQASGRKAPGWWMWLSLGLIPCPGTMIILLFFMSQKLFLLGILLSFVMAFGMSVTLGSVALLSAYLRNTIKPVQTVEGDRRRVGGAEVLGLMGAAFVLCCGVLLLWYSLG